MLVSLVSPTKIFADFSRIVDNANVLYEDQIAELNKQLEDLSSKYNYDLRVYFSIDNSFGDDIVSEGCEYYDSNGYGYGEGHSGVLFIVNYEQGYFDIITTGDEVRNKYDGYIEEAYDYLTPYLADDNPAEAIDVFCQWIDTRFISEGDSDDPVVVRDNRVTKSLGVAGGFSIFITTIVMIILKRQLKTEGKKRGANNYIAPHSFKLTRSGEIYLYNTISRRKIVRNNNNNINSHSGGGHSISHTSSSGISHGSGGGHSFR